MLPTQAQTVWILLLAIVPGFLAMSVWSRAKTWRGQRRDLHTVLYSLALSALIQLSLAPITISWLLPVRGDLERYPGRVVVWATLAALVVPVVGGIAAGRVTEHFFDPRSAAIDGRFARLVASMWRSAPPPSMWDWLFTANPPHGRFLLIDFW